MPSNLPQSDAADVATISFQAEAHDSAADAFRRLAGWTVDAFPADGEPFCATVGPVTTDPESGEYVVALRPWAPGASEASGRMIVMPLYGLRVEVL